MYRTDTKEKNICFVPLLAESFFPSTRHHSLRFVSGVRNDTFLRASPLQCHTKGTRTQIREDTHNCICAKCRPAANTSMLTYALADARLRGVELYLAITCVLFFRSAALRATISSVVSCLWGRGKFPPKTIQCNG
jgi:hypothetical protein